MSAIAKYIPNNSLLLISLIPSGSLGMNTKIKSSANSLSLDLFLFSIGCRLLLGAAILRQKNQTFERLTIMYNLIKSK